VPAQVGRVVGRAVGRAPPSVEVRHRPAE